MRALGSALYSVLLTKRNPYSSELQFVHGAFDIALISTMFCKYTLHTLSSSLSVCPDLRMCHSVSDIAQLQSLKHIIMPSSMPRY